MKVTNIHKRIISQPIDKVWPLLLTLSSKEDKIWPKEQWPAMNLDKGLVEGSKGGHGPIRYTVAQFIPKQLIQFQFQHPRGFNGYHQLEVAKVNHQKTELKHSILMQTKGSDTFLWIFVIRWLHDALIEDAFDKVENQFSEKKKKTPWNTWVRMLRSIFKKRK